MVIDIDGGGVDDRVTTLDDEGRHAISVVTPIELRLGVNKRYAPRSDTHEAALEGLERLLARFEILAVTRPIAATAADIIDDLQRRGLGLNDLHECTSARRDVSNSFQSLRLTCLVSIGSTVSGSSIGKPTDS